MTSVRRLVVVLTTEVLLVFGVIVLASSILDWNFGYFGSLLLAPALVFAWQVPRRLHEPDAPPRPARRPPPVETAFVRFQVIRERIRWGVGSGQHFDVAVRPVLTELAYDRMLRHHGIDRVRHPDEALARLEVVLGELGSGPGGEPPGIEALTRSVSKLEEQ